MEKVWSEDGEGQPMSSRVLSLYCRSWLPCPKASKQNYQLVLLEKTCSWLAVFVYYCTMYMTSGEKILVFISCLQHRP